MVQLHFHALHREARAVAPRRRVADPERSDDAETAGGPGWFDSSWALGHGLEVREAAPGDAALDEWLLLCSQAHVEAQRREPQTTARAAPMGRQDTAAAAPPTASTSTSEGGDPSGAFGTDTLRLR